MRVRALVGVAILMTGTAAVVSLRAQQATSLDVAALLGAADTLSLALKGDEALAKVKEALALATSRDDRIGIAMAQRQMGLVSARLGAGSEAGVWYARALDGFEALGNSGGVVQCLRGLVASAVAVGDMAKAREYGGRALKLLETTADENRAYLLSALISAEVDPRRTAVWNNEILEIANRLGDNTLRAVALKRQGIDSFNAGDFVTARARYEDAIASYERVGDIESIASTYLNLGRVFRAHGDYEGALQRYQKAIDLLSPTKERYTIVEATNAKAVALGLLKRPDEALATTRRGLELARDSGNPALIDFMEGNLAGTLVGRGRYEEALPLLRAVIDRRPTPYIASFRYGQLSAALFRTGKREEGLAALNEAIRLDRELKLLTELSEDLLDRAEMLTVLGRPEDALADARESVGIIDQIRKTVLPADFLKRGYSDRVNAGYVWMVDLLSQLGRTDEALEFAEQGRSRAFLDLLAARERGEAPSNIAVGAGPADLVSEAISKPLDLAGMSAVARRHDSTILSYWVGEEAVLVWAVAPAGAPLHVRVPITKRVLADRVAKTTAALRDSAAGSPMRGDNATGQDDELSALPMRGLGLLALSRDDKAIWRDLYRTLIAPVRARLPRTGRLTIVPHGPLFQLSFAALQTPAGRYLVEDYELNYAPSISVLDFTSRRQQSISGNAGSAWAIVGNPSTLPHMGRRPLPALPGAAEEIDSIVAMAPRGRTVVSLSGPRADEAELARMLNSANPSLLHFATHGFVYDDAKRPPFLALNRRGTQPGEDGRLTLDEVYGLRLNTDLVVLSACRTGSGLVSSDGVIGLTRGFFYAGSPSVLATFWDVTDAATASLMSGFYRQYVKTGAKSASLRTAQIALLRDLRGGRVVVSASGRRVTLPEHPLLWAAFFLTGEP